MDGIAPALYGINGGQVVGKWRLREFSEYTGGRLRHQSMPVIERSHQMRKKVEQVFPLLLLLRCSSPCCCWLTVALTFVCRA